MIDKHIFLSEARYRFSRVKNALGWPKFVLRSELMNPANKLMVNNKFTVLCEVCVHHGLSKRDCLIIKLISPLVFKVTAHICRYNVSGVQPTRVLSPPPVRAPTVESDQRMISDFDALFASRKHADVTFDIVHSDGTAGIKLPAHKAILAARSPVFAAMFEHKMKEHTERRVEISDIDVKVFEVMLHHIYTGVCPAEGSVPATELLMAANKVSC